MKKIEKAITHALAGEIFNRLKDSEYGEIPFKDHRVLFEAGPRNEKNEPLAATVEVITRKVIGWNCIIWSLKSD